MKKLHKKNKLVYKFSLPLFISILLTFILIIVISYSFLVKTNKRNTDEIVKSKIIDLQNNLEGMGNEALYAASICASLDFVNKAYNVYYATNDLDSATSIIRNEVNLINKSIESNLNIKPQIHYHLPPARSFIRCWSDKYGDDLTAFRKTVLQISKDHKPIKGIEVGRGGFVVRGIAPIFSKNQKYQGSVEVLAEFTNYLKESKNREDEEIAMFMNTQLLDIASGFLEESSSNVSDKELRIGNFINIDKTSQKFLLSNITAEDLEKGFNELYIFEKGSYKYGIYPIYDFTNEAVGLGIYQLDMSGFYASLRTMNAIIILLGLITLIALFIVISGLFYKYISKPINTAVTFTESIANGDLTASIANKSDDEIGILLLHMQNMKERLKAILNKIIAGTANITSAINEIRSSSEQISQGANEQASSTEEASASMEEMTASIQQNSDNSMQTEKIAVKAAEGIKQGFESSQISLEAMKNIADKIKIINDIAFQTNILALNAAVEAARAGEHGKGFAVVASEVRKLAEKSKLAADQISELSGNGVNISEKAGSELSRIVPEIERTAKLVQEISASSYEQSAGVEQINEAIQMLNQVTQQNAASAEQLATSAEELASQAEQLEEIVAYFKINLSDLQNVIQPTETNNLKKEILGNIEIGIND